MGCPCEIWLFGEKAHCDQVASQCRDEALRFEYKYSRYQQQSTLTQINNSAGTGRYLKVDAETAALLDYAQTCYQLSDGLFDITSGVLRTVWTSDRMSIPTPSELEQILERIGWPKVHWDGEALNIPITGMELDFGGFVKEYTADALAEICLKAGVSHGLINLGGDIRVIGPHPDGTPWRIGIRDPSRSGNTIAFVLMESGGLASSGNYERFLQIGSDRFSHILNPVTAWPVQGFDAVSVLAEQCLIAGSSATIAMLMEPHNAVIWLDELGLPNLRVSSDGKINGTMKTAVA